MTDSRFAARGPFEVGVQTRSFPSAQQPDRMLPTEIWYPARRGSGRRETADHPLGMPHRATPDLEPIDPASPVVIFSHGNSGLRQQSTFLTTHLASWGMVVAAPDHVGNTFSEMMLLETDEERLTTHLAARANRPHDLLGVVEALRKADPANEGLPPFDTDRLAILGHSYGGWTALKMPALLDGLAAVCCLAPASEPFVGRKAFGPDELPPPVDIPLLVLGAADDVLVDFESSLQPLYDRLGPNAELELIERSDHYHFCDGIEFLHTMHERNPQQRMRRPPRPWNELRGETEMHQLINERVARFLVRHLEVE